jgi:hypothetical protein
MDLESRANSRSSDALVDVFFCNNFVQTLATHHVDAPHETQHLYDLRDFDPAKVMAYDVVFVKTDFLDAFVHRVRKFVSVPFHLVTGHSDLTPSDDATEAITRDPDIVSWCAQNVTFETFKIRALPMGLTEPSRPFGDRRIVQKAFRKFADPGFVKADKIAVTHSSATHPIRPIVNAIVDGFKSRFSSEMAIAGGERIGYEEYLDFLGKNRYALVPRGNGIDCQRVYECILVRTVPVIVTDSPPAFYNKLPVIVLQPGPNGDIGDMIEKFLLKLRTGNLPPLPTNEEWKKYADVLRIENF